MLTKSRSSYCHALGFGTSKFAIEFSCGFVDLLAGYSAIWQLANGSEATSVDVEIARRAALDLAQDVQRTGTARAPQLHLDGAARAVAVQRTVTALRFLILHEAEHIRSGDLNGIQNISPNSLDSSESHAQEYSADLAAALTLRTTELGLNETLSSLKVLFELMHWLAFGVPGPQEAHPLAMARLLRVAKILDPLEYDRLEKSFLTRKGFWYLP